MKNRVLINIVALILVLLAGITTMVILLVTHEHTFDTLWTTDATYHWHKATCNHSGLVSAKEEHDYVYTSERASSCSVQGYKLYTCSVCNKTNREYLPLAGHAWGEVLYEGPTPYVQCGGCGQKSYNSSDFPEASLGFGACDHPVIVGEVA